MARNKSKTPSKVQREGRYGRYKTVIHHRKKKPSKAKCGSCGAVLSGVPRTRPFKLKKTPKTNKRPERPYGGVLCSKCMRKKIKTEARSEKNV